jgi:hypothetical protein
LQLRNFLIPGVGVNTLVEHTANLEAGGRSGDGPVHDQAASERAGLAVNARLLELI